MERLTEHDEYGNANIIGVDSADLQLNLNYEEFNKVTAALNKLAEYEDLAEQGRLMELPCRVGDTIYVIPSKTNYRLNIVNRQEKDNRIYEQVVDEVRFYPGGYQLQTSHGFGVAGETFYKETWFLTREEAEQKLKELEDWNANIGNKKEMV